jgi:hypothetical protein
MSTTHYDSYDDGSAESSDDNTEVRFTPYTTIEAVIGGAYGSDSQYGQSLGVAFDDVELTDGALYADVDKGRYKLFSWQRAADMTPTERLERGDEPSVDDAPDFMRKTYFGNDKEYELVAARVPELTDDDGSVLVEASSKTRSVSFTTDGADFGEWEYLDGDKPELPNLITWEDGTDENGATVTAQTIAETITSLGDDAVVDADDVYNWLADTSTDNILRDDLEGRRIRFFIVQRDGDDYTYNLPIIEDVATGERIQPNNRDDGSDTGNSDSGTAQSVEDVAEQDAGTYPEPIADFISSGRNLELTEQRANTLLDQMVEDSDNSITMDMVNENGGRDEIIGQVV